MRDDQAIVDTKYGLTQRQLDFCIAYVETGNGSESARRAGYSPKTCKYQGSMLLTRQNIKNKIYDLRHDETKLRIASGREVMDFFTRVMNGEVLDQFGLEASLSDRLKAANELAKRTTDVDLKATGTADNKIHIKLDWGSDDEEETNEFEDDGK